MLFYILEVWSEVHILLIELHKSILKVPISYLGARLWKWVSGNIHIIPNWITVHLLEQNCTLHVVLLCLATFPWNIYRCLVEQLFAHN
jgi:hypothetical protein